MIDNKRVLRRLVRGAAAVALLAALDAGTARAAIGSGRQMDQAHAYFRANKLQEAAITLKNVIRANPKDVSAHLLLAKVYLKAGGGLAAQSELDLARNSGADRNDTALDYARALRLQGNNDAALKELDAVSLPEAQRAEGLTVRGDAFLGKRNIDKATAAYSEAMKLAPRSAEPRLGLARLYLDQRNFDAAIKKADEAAALEPANPFAHTMRGLALEGRRDIKGAAEAFGTALKVEPRFIPALIDRAAIFLNNGQEERAKADIDSLARLAPQHPMRFYLSSLYLTRKGKYKEAQEELGRTGSRLEGFMPAVFLSGVLSYTAGNRQLGIARLRQVVSAVPSHVPARRVLAFALIETRQGDEAIRVLRPLVEGGQADSQIFGMLGMAQMQTGDFDDAVASFDKASAGDKSRSGLYETQEALAQIALGKNEAAMKSLSLVMKSNPKDARAGIVRALVAARAGDIKTALSAIQQVIAADPRNPVGYNVRGMIQLGVKRIPEARADFEKALGLNPKFRAARINLARAHVQQKNYRAAEQEYRKILADAPNDDAALTGLSALMQMRGEPRAAIRLLETASANQPKSIPLRIRLVSAFMAAKDMDGALRAAEAADRDIPNAAGIISMLGDLYAAKRDWRRATASYNRVATLRPEDMMARFLLGQAQLSGRRIDSARLTLSNALKLRGQDQTRLAILNQLITLETQDGKFDQALRYAIELRTAFPKENYSELMLGELYLGNKRYKEALQNLQAAKKKKDGFRVRAALFNTYIGMGRPREAIGEIKEYVAKSPKGREAEMAQNILANAYLNAGMYKEAAAAYEIVVKKEPKNAASHNNLAWAYLALKDRRAIQAAETAARLAPKSPDIGDTLGWVLVSFNQDVPRALAILQLSARDKPRDLSVQYHLATALVKTGRTREGRDMLRGLLLKSNSFDGAAEARALLKSLGG